MLLTTVVDSILGTIGTILYPLFSTIFLLIDLVQNLFYGFAGIGSLTYDGTTISGSGEDFANDADGGIVYYLLNSDFVQDMFWSMAYLALILIVIFVGIAFFRNIYASKPKNWKDIVGDAIKGICNFVFVPVILLLGIWVGNILLRAVNDATSVYGDATISRQLFIASAYNANYIRTQGYVTEDQIAEAQAFCTKYGVSYDASETDYEYWASKIDECYASADGPSITSAYVTGDGPATWYWLININYIALLGGGLFILYALGAITFGMIKRLIFIIVLYIIGPVVCSMYPIDGGKAVDGWRKQLTSYVLMAYGAVVGLNLTLSILPLLQNIDFTLWGYWWTDWITNGILPTLLTIVALLCAKEFISMFSGWVGGGDAYGVGAGVMSATKSQVQRGGKHIGHAAKKVTDYSFKLGNVITGGRGATKERKEYKQAQKDLSEFNKDNKGALTDKQQQEKETLEKRVSDAKTKYTKANKETKKNSRGAAIRDLGKTVLNDAKGFTGNAVNYLTGGVINPKGMVDTLTGDYKDNKRRNASAQTPTVQKAMTELNEAAKKQEVSTDQYIQHMTPDEINDLWDNPKFKPFIQEAGESVAKYSGMGITGTDRRNNMGLRERIMSQYESAESFKEQYEATGTQAERSLYERGIVSKGAIQALSPEQRLELIKNDDGTYGRKRLSLSAAQASIRGGLNSDGIFSDIDIAADNYLAKIPTMRTANNEYTKFLEEFKRTTKDAYREAVSDNKDSGMNTKDAFKDLIDALDSKNTQQVDDIMKRVKDINRENKNEDIEKLAKDVRKIVKAVETRENQQNGGGAK